jgi:hypothetical protein
MEIHSMKQVIYSVIVAGLALVVGCGPDGKTPTVKQVQNADQLKGRLDAAMAITEPDRKNDALKSVAEDAADAGHVEYTKAAINQITEPDRKNKVAATCALKLSHKGDTGGATAIAQLITEPDLKNRTLSKISKGE